MTTHTQSYRISWPVVGLLVMGLPFVPMAPGELGGNEVSVRVDPRMELLGIVQFLAGYGEMGLISPHASEYLNEIMAEFSAYKDHAAVKQFAAMMTNGFNFDGPPTAMLHLSPPPQLEVVVPFSDYAKRKAGGEDGLLRFVEHMRDFAEKSSFGSFFEKQRSWYDELIAATLADMGDQDYITTLESYFGEGQHSYSFILAPLFQGGYGPRVVREDGTCDVYSIIGPQAADGGSLVFGSPESFRNWMWHEFGHSFVNHLTDESLDEVDRCAGLYEPIAETMKKQGYGVWRTCVDEHILRATTIRLMALHVDAESASAMLQSDKDRGFIYLDALLDALERYEARRERYPTFTDFYPELLNVLQTIETGSGH